MIIWHRNYYMILQTIKEKKSLDVKIYLSVKLVVRTLIILQFNL